MPRVPTKAIPDVAVERGPVVFQNVAGSNDPSAFGAGVGRALGGLGDQISAEGQVRVAAENRIQNRRATISRIKRRGALQQELFSHFNDIDQQQDITDPDVIQRAADTGRGIMNKSIFENFDEGASQENSLIFEAEANTMFNKFADDLVKKSISTSKKLVDEATGTAIREGAARAANDPSSVLREMDEGAKQALISLSGAIDVADEGVFVRKYQAQVAQSAINSLFLKGATDPGSLEEAMTTLANPQVASVLSSAERDQFFKRKTTIGQQPRILSTAETAKLLRLDPAVAEETVVQEGPKGVLSILLKPTKNNQVRQQKIDDAVTAGSTLIDATDNVDGNIELILIPETSEVLRNNRRTGEITVMQRAQPKPAGEQVEPSTEPGLYQKIKDNPLAVTGLGGAAVEIFGGIGGQVPGVPISRSIIQTRQDIRSAQNTMIQAFSLNPRFPVGLIKILKEDIRIESSIFDSDRALLLRLEGINRTIRKRIESNQKIGDNVTLPRDVRGNAKTAVVHMKEFLRELGVPKDADANAPEDPPIHIFTQEQYDALEPGAPYIHPDGRRKNKASPKGKK